MSFGLICRVTPSFSELGDALAMLGGMPIVTMKGFPTTSWLVRFQALWTLITPLDFRVKSLVSCLGVYHGFVVLAAVLGHHLTASLLDLP